MVYQIYLLYQSTKHTQCSQICKCTKVIAFSETQMVESLSLGAALARSFTPSVCKYHCLVTWTLDNAPEYIVYNQTCYVSGQSLFSLPTCMPAFSGPQCTSTLSASTHYVSRSRATCHVIQSATLATFQSSGLLVCGKYILQVVLHKHYYVTFAL